MDTPHQAIIAGAGLNLAAKQLKVAFPKKKQQATTTIVVEGKPGILEFRLPGVAVEVPAAVGAPFDCQVPWLFFSDTLLAKPNAETLLRFEFANGWYAIDSIRVSSPQIILESGQGHTGFDDNLAALESAPVEQPAASPASAENPDPTASPLGLPLLAAYAYVRRFGLQKSLANQAFVAQQREVLATLSFVEKWLAPYGVSREELESLLDRKCLESPAADYAALEGMADADA